MEKISMPFNIMWSRYDQLIEAMDGYRISGVPLVGYLDSKFTTIHNAEDLGIFYFIPQFASIFNLTLDQSIIYFFYSIVIISFILGIIGFFLYFKSFLARFISLVVLLIISAATIRIGGLYSLSSSIVMAVIPCFLYLLKRNKIDKYFYFFIILASFFISWAGFIRLNTGFGILLFIVISLFFNFNFKMKQKIFIILILLTGYLIPQLYIKNLHNNRDAFLSQHIENYEKPLGHHILWHSIFMGFSFLDNKYGIEYVDTVAHNFAKKVNPNVKYISLEHDDILRKLVFKLLRKDPLFVFSTIFAKAGVIIMYLLVGANIGLILSIFYRKELPLELAFWCSLIFCTLNGLLVLPRPHYLLEFIAFSTLYGLFSINYALENGLNNKILTFLKIKKQ